MPQDPVEECRVWTQEVIIKLHEYLFDLIQNQEGGDQHSIGVLQFEIQYIDISPLDYMMFPG